MDQSRLSKIFDTKKREEKLKKKKQKHRFQLELQCAICKRNPRSEKQNEN